MYSLGDLWPAAIEKHSPNKKINLAFLINTKDGKIVYRKRKNKLSFMSGDWRNEYKIAFERRRVLSSSLISRVLVLRVNLNKRILESIPSYR